MADRTAARRGLARLWLVTIVLVIAAAVLWSLAEDEVVERVELVGHATATFETTETEIDPLLASLAGAAAVLAVASGYLLVRRSFTGPGGSTPDWMTTVGLLLLFGVLGAGAAVLAAVRDAPEGYETVDEVVRAMRSHNIDCSDLQRSPLILIDEERVDEVGPNTFEEVAVCRVEAVQELEDGYDDVLIGIWAGRDARAEFEETLEPGRRGFVIIRDTWFVQCQFTSTCSTIENELRPP